MTIGGDLMSDSEERIAKGATKYDQGKMRWDLMAFYPLDQLCKVLTFGAEKYEPNGWRGVEVERYRAAAFRHMSAYMQGEKYDPETGLEHLAHAMCNLMFIMELEREDTSTTNTDTPSGRVTSVSAQGDVKGYWPDVVQYCPKCRIGTLQILGYQRVGEDAPSPAFECNNCYERWT